MEHKHKKSKTGRILFLVLLLALLCIGGVELLVCSIADPALFERLTQPVTAFFQNTASAIQEALPDPPPTEPPEEEAPDSQMASDAALENTLAAEDPVITEFTQQNGVEILTGGNVAMVYYNQSEEPWSSHPYGPDEIGGYGCGPTAMAMLVSSLTDEMMDPGAMADWAYREGYCAPGSGSYYSLIEGAAAAFGLEMEPWNQLTADALSQSLASGHVFVALMTRGHFTSNGHFILLRGLTLEGKVLVADPNSRERSLVAWDPQLIVDELSPTRASGAPLWCFSALPMENRG